MTDPSETASSDSTGSAVTDPIDVTEPPQARRRGRQTAFDMVRSLGLVLLFVAVLLAVTWRAKPDPVRVVDYKAATASARLQIDWPVLSPTGLPDAWRATSARIDLGADDAIEWYVGMVTPSDQFASVAQSDVKGGTALRKYIADRTEGAVESGTSTVAGTSWRRFVSDDQTTRSLVRSDKGVTIVVTGTTGWDELSTFVGSLRSG
jgi:hypothetical protein